MGYGFGPGVEKPAAKKPAQEQKQKAPVSHKPNVPAKGKKTVPQFPFNFGPFGNPQKKK